MLYTVHVRAVFAYVYNAYIRRGVHTVYSTYVSKASFFNTKDRDTSRVEACLIHWVFSAVHCSCSIYKHVRIHVSNSYSPKLTLAPEL